MFFGIVGYAKTAGYWNGDVPDYIYRQLVPHADEVEHPGGAPCDGAECLLRLEPRTFNRTVVVAVVPPPAAVMVTV